MVFAFMKEGNKLCFNIRLKVVYKATLPLSGPLIKESRFDRAFVVSACWHFWVFNLFNSMSEISKTKRKPKGLTTASLPASLPSTFQNLLVFVFFSIFHAGILLVLSFLEAELFHSFLYFSSLLRCPHLFTNSLHLFLHIYKPFCNSCFKVLVC